MAQAARKVTAKDANEKLAHRRLTVLELAERLGNVAEACRRGGIDRTSFYDWKRRFQLEGLDGLKDLPPIEEPPDDHRPGGGGQDRGAGARASRLRLQPDRGALGPGRPPGVGDHRAEDPRRSEERRVGKECRSR